MYSSLGICRVFPPKLTQLSELTVLSCCSHRMSSRFAPHPLNKPCPLFSCRAHKLLIVGRHIYLCPITIGFLHVGYPMIGKFFGKTPLMCPKCQLTASPCLWGVGRYHIYSQMPHCPAKPCPVMYLNGMRRIVFIHSPIKAFGDMLSSCLRSMPVVASSIGIEGTE